MGAHPSGPLERTVNNYFGAGCSRYLFPSQRRRRGRQRGPILRGGKKRPGRKPRHNKVDTFYNFACRATVCRVLEPVACGATYLGGAPFGGWGPVQCWAAGYLGKIPHPIPLMPPVRVQHASLTGVLHSHGRHDHDGATLSGVQKGRGSLLLCHR